MISKGRLCMQTSFLYNVLWMRKHGRKCIYKIIVFLRNVLHSGRGKEKILREAMTTTPWIYGVIKEVCKK